VTRTNPLAGGEAELERNYGGLLVDFCGFMPLARSYAIELIGKSCDE